MNIHKNLIVDIKILYLTKGLQMMLVMLIITFNMSKLI